MTEDARSKSNLIIGAGLTGLLIARKLQARGEEVRLLEKSRGVGGRMATRRSGTVKFDHGAQFYTRQPPLEELHQQWLEQGLSSHWFDQGAKAHFKCGDGMTALAKNLATTLKIHFEEKVVGLRHTTQPTTQPTTQQTSHGWTLQCESGKDFAADRVILTAPLPQALELLRKSEIGYDLSLESVEYAKAVVALIELEEADHSLTDKSGFAEPTSSAIFSIADQMKKGVSASPALTVALRPEASALLYDKSDESATTEIVAELQKLGAKFSPKTIQIKKWRYAHPKSHFKNLYTVVDANLFLAGDAFGGASLNGAARSANALANHLLRAQTSV